MPGIPVKRSAKTNASSGAARGTRTARNRGDPREPKPITGDTIGRVLTILRREARGWNAPVLTLMAAEKHDPFLTLIGCILSLRTNDKTTAIAAPRLFARARTPAAMLAMEPSEIEKLIYPVGFYRTKARGIREICRDLIDRFDGRVPDEIDDLLTLKGVGRKTANLVVTESFRKPGICVDTHVHRISNRWGLVATKTADKTETALRQALPRRYWIEYNGLVVAFGQTICNPTSPWCSRCPLTKVCPRIGVARSR
jgi:endonuclease-3